MTKRSRDRRRHLRLSKSGNLSKGQRRVIKQLTGLELTSVADMKRIQDSKYIFEKSETRPEFCPAFKAVQSIILSLD